MSLGNLLAADDDITIRGIVSRFGEKAGFQVQTVEDGASFLESITEKTDLLLLDLNMPKVTGFQCLEILRKKHPNLPAIVLSGEQGASEAVQAMKLGAVDYLTKPFDPEELIAVLTNALRLRNTIVENEGLRESISTSAQVSLVSESPKMQEIMQKVRKIAPLPSTVLLTGESGAGKGVVARQIHELGNIEGKNPFITVSCPAIPRDLLESELFGHEKGAFTGAVKSRIGKFELAQGGTLFLDEIGELPLELQSKLLNVLQEREFQRIGGNKTIPLNARLITATNIDFTDKIAEGSFREDLYYRLNVIPIEIPPLRDRKEELEVLSEHLLSKISQRQGRAEIKLSKEALHAILKYDWPGNVRQLENELERASAFCDNLIIQLSDLSLTVTEPLSNKKEFTVGMTLQEMERVAIIDTLKLTGGNKKEAARILGIAEKSIYNKIQKLNLNA